MADRTFEERLARMHTSDAAPHKKAADPITSGPVKTERNNRERLAVALAHLERGGVTGSYAYSPAFRKLAGAGISL